MQDLLSEEVAFIRKMREYDDITLVQTFDAISFIFQESKEMFETIKKNEENFKGCSSNDNFVSTC